MSPEKFWSTAIEQRVRWFQLMRAIDAVFGELVSTDIVANPLSLTVVEPGLFDWEVPTLFTDAVIIGASARQHSGPKVAIAIDR